MSSSNSPVSDLLKTLIQIQGYGVPLNDFCAALKKLSLADQYTNPEIQTKLRNSNSIYSSHNADHIGRVVFWVFYLVEISNRCDYPISAEESRAAVYAAVIHDLCREDELPGGEHGKKAAEVYKPFMWENLNGDFAERCFQAVCWHGYAEEPLGVDDPIWMLLKDADALDRGRFACIHDSYGLDPNRLRLAILKENIDVLHCCLEICVQLPKIISQVNNTQSIFHSVANILIEELQILVKTADPEISDYARKIIEIYSLLEYRE